MTIAAEVDADAMPGLAVRIGLVPANRSIVVVRPDVGDTVFGVAMGTVVLPENRTTGVVPLETNSICKPSLSAMSVRVTVSSPRP